ncbi:hypothetical protein Q7P37_002216 [Cladosporium fusiforme]
MLLSASVHRLIEDIRSTGEVDRGEIVAQVARLVKEHPDAVPDEFPGNGEDQLIQGVDDAAVTNRFTGRPGGFTQPIPGDAIELTRLQQLNGLGTLRKRMKSNNERMANGRKAIEYSGKLLGRAMGGPYAEQYNCLLGCIDRQVLLSNTLAELGDENATADAMRMCGQWTLKQNDAEAQQAYDRRLEQQYQSILNALMDKRARTTQQWNSEREDDLLQDESLATSHLSRSRSRPLQESASEALIPQRAMDASRETSDQLESIKRRARSSVSEAAPSKARKIASSLSSAQLSGIDTQSQASDDFSLPSLKSNGDNSNVAVRLDLNGVRRKDSRWIWWRSDMTRAEFFQKVSDLFQGQAVQTMIVRSDEKRIILGSEDEWKVLKMELLKSSKDYVSAEVRLIERT